MIIRTGSRGSPTHSVNPACQNYGCYHVGSGSLNKWSGTGQNASVGIAYFLPGTLVGAAVSPAISTEESPSCRRSENTSAKIGCYDLLRAQRAGRINLRRPPCG